MRGLNGVLVDTVWWVFLIFVCVNFLVPFDVLVLGRKLVISVDKKMIPFYFVLSFITLGSEFSRK